MLFPSLFFKPLATNFLAPKTIDASVHFPVELRLLSIVFSTMVNEIVIVLVFNLRNSQCLVYEIVIILEFSLRNSQCSVYEIVIVLDLVWQLGLY